MKVEITGEYWIINGSAEYADGDNGEKNHEIIAYEYIASENIELIYDFAKSLNLNLPSLKSIELDYERIVDHTQDLLFAIRNVFKNLTLDSFCDNFAHKTGIDPDAVKVLVQGANYKSSTDPRVYMMKKEKWIAVRNNNIELYGLDANQIKNLASGLDDVLEQENHYDVNDEDIELNVYDFKNNKSIHLTLKEIKNNKIFKPQTLPQTTYNKPLPTLTGKQYGRELWRGTSESFAFKDWLIESETTPMGLCFPYANNLAMEMIEDGVVKEKDIFVCHGEVEEPLSNKPKKHLHAWVEAKVLGEERVYDWQMKTAKNSLSKQEFYELFKPINVVKYTNKQSMINCLKHKHHGPWA